MNNSPYALPLIQFLSPPPHPYPYLHFCFTFSVVCYVRLCAIVVFNVFFICIMYVLSCLRLCHVPDLTSRLVLGLWFCPMDFLYFLNLYLWYGFALPSYPLFSSYKNEDMGYVMLCNACNVMRPSPPHIHTHITSTPYSLHTLGQLFLQTSVRPSVTSFPRKLNIGFLWFFASS